MKKVRRILTMVLAVVMAAGVLASCGTGDSEGGSVATDGSTSMSTVINALGEVFTEENEGVNFTYNPTGSGSGISAVLEGRCDIGLSSRYLKDEEKTEGLVENILCLEWPNRENCLYLSNPYRR